MSTAETFDDPHGGIHAGDLGIKVGVCLGFALIHFQEFLCANVRPVRVAKPDD